MMRWSHRWETDTHETIEALCPYCRKWVDDEAYEYNEGDVIYCYHCGREFVLGKSK